MTENTCVCCGCIIPEGRQVCAMCERKSEIRPAVKIDSAPLAGLRELIWRFFCD